MLERLVQCSWNRLRRAFQKLTSCLFYLIMLDLSETCVGMFSAQSFVSTKFNKHSSLLYFERYALCRLSQWILWTMTEAYLRGCSGSKPPKWILSSYKSLKCIKTLPKSLKNSQNPGPRNLFWLRPCCQGNSVISASDVVRNGRIHITETVLALEPIWQTHYSAVVPKIDPDRETSHTR